MKTIIDQMITERRKLRDLDPRDEFLGLDLAELASVKAEIEAERIRFEAEAKRRLAAIAANHRLLCLEGSLRLRRGKAA